MVTFNVGPVYVGRRDYKERRIPHSLNARLHWAVRNNWNAAWKEAVWEQVMVNRKAFGRLPYKRARVTFTLNTIRQLDLDNAYTCIKPLLDALKTHVLTDDNPNCLELVVNQNRVAHTKDERVTVLIETLDGGAGRQAWSKAS